MEPITPKIFIENLCRENGQNTTKDAAIAGALDRHINTGFRSQGCFINELIQNADDQMTHETEEISFCLIGNELIVYHQGKTFDESDVKGISSYGNVSENRKNYDVEKSGYKDIGFKAVFRMAYRVDIWSNEWHFHFDETSEKWKIDGRRDTRYPWQIAPIWTEENDLSSTAKTIVSMAGRTSFIFKLRFGINVEAELGRYYSHPEQILFLKKIRKIHFIINNSPCSITHREGCIYVNDQFRSAWNTDTQVLQVPLHIQEYLQRLGPQECPEKLRGVKECTLSLSYSNQVPNPLFNLFSTLSTAESVGFPFLVNAPFLLNPSRESLTQNDWNIFLIQSIAHLNFNFVRTNLLNRNYDVLKFLALPVMHGTLEVLSTVFGQAMGYLMQNYGFLPGEFGNLPIKIYECEIDERRIYNTLHNAGVILSETTDRNVWNLVHGKIDQSEILKRHPGVKKIELKNILHNLPRWLTMSSEKATKEQSICMIRSIFLFWKNKVISGEVLESLRETYLYTQSGHSIPCFKLCLPDCYQPTFSYERNLPGRNDLLVSEEYLDMGTDIASDWKVFFTVMGALDRCEIVFKESINIQTIHRDDGLDSYLRHLWNNSRTIRPQTRRNFEADDKVQKFLWFPYIKEIQESKDYKNVFWRVFQSNIRLILRCNSTTLHYYQGKKGDYEQTETYLQFIFRTEKLIQDQQGEFRFAQELYAPSLIASEGIFLTKRAQLPIQLSQEMEDWIGFQRVISVEDCYHLIIQQYQLFNYAAYECVLKHLVKHLKDPKKRIEIQSKPWKFYTTNGMWIEPIPRGILAEPNRLYYWSDSFSSPPQDNRSWMEAISSLSKEEMQEFCAFFHIEQVSNYANTANLQKAVSGDDLKAFLEERLLDILFFWKRLNENRKIEDCYEQIVDKLHLLIFLVLPEEEFSDGQIFIENQSVLYYACGWEDNKRLLAKVLGNYFGFTDKEIVLLERAIGKYPRRYTGDELIKFNVFKRELEGHRRRTITSKENERRLSPPLSPRSALSPIPFSLIPFEATMEFSLLHQQDELPSCDSQFFSLQPERKITPSQIQVPILQLHDLPVTDEQESKISITPKTPLSQVQRRSPAGHRSSSTPSGSPEQPLRPAITPSTTPKVTPKLKRSPSDLKDKKATDSPKKELTEEQELEKRQEKKRIGMWAERHVFWNKQQKYEKKYGGAELLENGIRKYTDTKTAKTIELKWNNDPQNRPEEQKNNDLWDSGQAFDIEIIKKVGESVKRKMIEVKGTPGNHVHFFLGSSEWQCLLRSNLKEYQIYVITKAETDHAECTPIIDLFAFMKENHFNYISKTEFTAYA